MNRTKLGDVAKVFRCALKREEVEDSTFPILWTREALPLWHEVKVENVDPLTGFISGPLTTVEVDGDPDRDAIRITDTVFCFQGTPQRIIRPAMLLYEWAAIPGRTMGIVRPGKHINPIWLYYFICDAVPDLELEMKNGRAFLNLQRIRDLEFDMPTEEEVRKINNIHKEMVEDFRKYHKRQRERTSKIREIRLGMDILP